MFGVLENITGSWVLAIVIGVVIVYAIKGYNEDE